jgi:hypothetical protein
MTDESDDADPEELLQQSKERKRHTTEPDRSTDSPDFDRVEAIKNALIAIDEGDAPENINLRDARLKGLLVGLEVADELQRVATELNTIVDGDLDVDPDDISQSDVARLLLRVGLKEAIPEVLEDAQEARKQKAVEQAEGF